jgi:hypothetical protein
MQSEGYGEQYFSQKAVEYNILVRKLWCTVIQSERLCDQSNLVGVTKNMGHAKGC